MQIQKATSQIRKNNLYKELIQVEIQLKKMAKQSALYHEHRAVEAIQNNIKYFFSYAKRKSKFRTSVGPLQNQATN